MATILDLLMGEFPKKTPQEIKERSLVDVRYSTHPEDRGVAVRISPSGIETFGKYDEHGQFVSFDKKENAIFLGKLKALRLEKNKRAKENTPSRGRTGQPSATREMSAQA